MFIMSKKVSYKKNIYICMYRVLNGLYIVVKCYLIVK